MYLLTMNIFDEKSKNYYVTTYNSLYRAIDKRT